jgi:hypothetical protein
MCKQQISLTLDAELRGVFEEGAERGGVGAFRISAAGWTELRAPSNSFGFRPDAPAKRDAEFMQEARPRGLPPLLR